MIYQRLQKYIREKQLSSYDFLLQPLDGWANKHFVALASILLVSESTVKRLFKYPGHTPPNHMNQTTREKLASFLEYADWMSLENELIRQVSKEIDE
ncbi:MAG: hypothetical protein R8G66_22150 [Cytophagales bacterium]|nr:hypothetical protein [Cytophagales bacterium]